MGLHSIDRQYRVDAAVTQSQPAPKCDIQIDTEQDVAENGLPTRTCVATAPPRCRSAGLHRRGASVVVAIAALMPR